jgi:hypothetical protein
LSVDALHEIVIDVAVGALATNPVGTVGACVSVVQDDVAAVSVLRGDRLPALS